MIPYPFKSFPIKCGRKTVFYDGLAQIEKTGPDYRKDCEAWVVLDFKARRQNGDDTLFPDEHIDSLARWLHATRENEIVELLK